MDKKGITLIEMLIVVAIIGILAAVAIPAYIGQQTRAARTEAYTNLQSLRLLEEQYYAENGCYYSTGGTCTNSTTAMDTLAEIQAVLPGFKPGDDASLNYSYKIETAGTPAASAFTATATGKTGTRVDGDSFWIKQDNTKNF
jgi:prepilin-type N-terminal cleavage/methylation domain-containing protein